MNKVLITGVNGFLGNALWSYLSSCDNLDVYGIARITGTLTGNMIACDLLDKDLLCETIEDIAPDYVFHLCGLRTQDEEKLINSNIITTQNLISALKSSSLKSTRLVIPGSAAEYGKLSESLEPIDETAQCKPLSTYGKIKFEQTSYALSETNMQCQVMIGRIFNVLGGGTPRDLVAGSFANQIVEIENGKGKKNMQVYPLSGYRDFLDIKDLAAALWDMSLKGESGGIYNICSSQPTSVRSLLELFISASNSDGISYNEIQSTGSNSFSVIGDNKKIMEQCSWRPNITLEESVLNTLMAYR